MVIRRTITKASPGWGFWRDTQTNQVLACSRDAELYRHEALDTFFDMPEDEYIFCGGTTEPRGVDCYRVTPVESTGESLGWGFNITLSTGKTQTVGVPSNATWDLAKKLSKASRTGSFWIWIEEV